MTSTALLIFKNGSNLELGRITIEEGRLRSFLDELSTVASVYSTNLEPRQHARMLLDQNAGTGTITFG